MQRTPAMTAKSVLLITSSPNTLDAASTSLARRLADGLTDGAPDARVVARDLGAAPPPHLDQATIGAFYTPEAERTAEQKGRIALSDELVDEL
ncbi:MAG: FMN-dependent NADH-azoreductase, partial [Rhodospirillales bacterium CG15_BIG_FIL_POST_REV_8_21_14_020_66_15]